MKNNKQTKRKTPVSNKKVAELEKKLAKLSAKQSKPFANTGKIIGSSIGGMFGSSKIGAGVGRWLGSGIGSIFGSGDYTTMGPNPSYNVLTNGSQIPKFSTTHQTNVVCHREYLGDINGTAGFNNLQYPLNPGMATTFPWLSVVAQNYQEYKFHGLVFEFKSLLTDFVTGGSPGVVIMSTNYNADDLAYTTKQQMENSEYAVSTKPTCNMMHGIECATGQTILPQKYVRNGAVPAGQDLRLYDQGVFQFATQQNPITDIGELWVSYCVEFFKPTQSEDFGGNAVGNHTYRSLVTSASPLGTVQLSNVGNLSLTSTATTLTFLGQPQQQYYITVIWLFGSGSVWTPPAFAISGATFPGRFAGDTLTSVTTPITTTVTDRGTFSAVILCNALNPTNVTLTLSGATFPVGASSVDIYITELDNAVIN